MRTNPFETYRQKLADGILQSENYEALEDQILEAEWELADEPVYDTRDETMIAILKKSHAEALAGKTFSMEEVERLMDERIYELTHRMDGFRAAEPIGCI